MKNLIKLLLLVFIAVFLATGCASYYSLKQACATGRTEVFPYTYDTAFSKTKNVLKGNNLVIYRISKKSKFIVAMGFPRQVNTTRVGIFFEPLSDNETKITLSSLSSTALEKADKIIFGGLKPPKP
jgi:hypothetical protein